MIQTFTRALALLEYGVAAVTAAGQEECGGRHLVKTIPDGALLAVVDGLGQGREAAAAARKAIGTIEANLMENAGSLVQLCHEQLKGTRGAVVSVAIINRAENTMTWAGVGNIEGLLLRCNYSGSCAPESMLLTKGIVGGHLPMLRTLVTPIAPGDLVILATDGIRPDVRRVASEEQPRKIAEYISSSYRAGLDDGLVLVARYQGCRD